VGVVVWGIALPQILYTTLFLRGPSSGATEKKDLQEAIGNGTWRGRYTPEEIFDYCEGDVMALAQLLPAMLPSIDLPRALLRGRYMAAN
jgi:DNA polymerase I